MVNRQILACILVFLLACPAFSNPNFIGRAVSSKDARVRGAELSAGTPIVSGDRVDVGENGRARINLADGGMMRLDANTQIRLTRTAEKIEFELTKGRAAFRFPGRPMQARLADAVIASANGQEAVGLIDMLSPTKALIASVKGELRVTPSATAKSVTLREGESVEVTLSASPAAPPPAAGTSHATVIALGTVVAGALTAVLIAFAKGQDKPNDQQRRNAVSPFRVP